MTREQLIAAYQKARRDEKLASDEKAAATERAVEANARHEMALSVVNIARTAMLIRHRATRVSVLPSQGVVSATSIVEKDSWGSYDKRNGLYRSN